MLWLFSEKFGMFLLARVVGGLSEGNVQISQAMIFDMTTAETRSRGLALVGIAFALGFTVGPALGAYLSGFENFISINGVGQFSTVALVSVLLLVFETVYIWFKVPETLGHHKLKQRKESPPVSRKSSGPVQSRDVSNKEPQPVHQRWILLLCYGMYLFCFSGMEFTLTFLTFERFDYSNAQQGKLLAVIGVLSSAMQGWYVRKYAHKIGELVLVIQGIGCACLSCYFLAVTGTDYDFVPPVSLWLAAFFFAIASATVVNGFTSLYSLSHNLQAVKQQPISEHGGEMLGRLRSVGQLGRALGPIFFCSIYWLKGSVASYLTACLGIFMVLLIVLLNRPKNMKI